MYIIFYIFFGYLLSALMFRPLKRRVAARRARQGEKAPYYVLGILLLLLPWLPYGAIAVQTALFGRMLLPAVHQSFIDCGQMCGDVHDRVLTYQVLWITPSATQVYLVTPCTGWTPNHGDYRGLSATTITLIRTAHGWRYSEYDTPWSDCGSADGNIFPPDPRGG